MSLTPSIYAHSIVALSYAAFAPILVFRGARSWLNALFALAAPRPPFGQLQSSLSIWSIGQCWTAELAGSLRDGLWFAVVLAIIYPDAKNQIVWRILAATTAGIVLHKCLFRGLRF